MSLGRLNRARRCLYRLVLFVCATLAAPVGAMVNGPTAAASAPPAHHPDRLLARLKAPHGATQTQVGGATASLAALGLHITRRIDSVPGMVVIESAPVALAATRRVPATLDQRISALRASGLFEYVEPDYVLSVQAIPRDAHLADGTLWSLHNTGQRGGTPGIDVAALRAWEITTGSREVIVAVIDTGIDFTHTELREQMWRNPGEIPGNGIDDDGNGIIDDVFGLNVIDPRRPPFDDHDHGTHVAGTIGAAANDGHPLVGVAPQVQLMACKFLTAEGWGYTADAVTCIDYAARNGASIINASWGGGGYSEALVDSIAAAGDAGALFVAAAGNSGLDLQSATGDRFPAYPASYELDTIMAVAAIDRNGELAAFSNFGRLSVDLGAPGVEILSSTARAGKTGYATFRGTSMAAPHVSGVAALARARHPTLTPRELKALLLETATPTPALEGRTVTGGRIDAFGAVSAQVGQRLALSLSLPASHVAPAGRPLLVSAFVTDLHAVTGATVTGSTDHGETLVFRDDGIAPDVRADDAVYSALATALPGRETISITAQAAQSGLTSAARSVTVPVLERPPNDDFSAAARLDGHVILVTAPNRAATLEPGEPAHADQPGGASLWWVWTAPADCTVSLRTRSVVLDTLLAVYTGASLASLEPIASNDNAPGAHPSSALAFAATAGAEYRIAVDTWDGAAGTVELELTTSLPPPNDDFANAERLHGTLARPWGSTHLATRELGETSSRGRDGPSVWYTWTAPVDGTADLGIWSYGNGWDTIEVYAGASPAALTPVPNLVTGLYAPWRLHRFHAIRDKTYHIAIRGLEAEGSGYFQLDLQLLDPPPNDTFAGRLPLTGDEFSVNFDNRGASREPGEPEVTSESSTSIWYAWTAPRDGTASFHIPPVTGFAPTMAAFSGARLDGLTCVALGDHQAFLLYLSNRGTHLVFEATRNTTYAIVIDGAEGGSGSGTLRLRLLDPPLNHRPTSAFPIPGDEFIAEATNRGAADPNPQTPVGPTPARVWWSWTAPATGRFAVDVTTTHFGPQIDLLPNGQGSSPVELGGSFGWIGCRTVFGVQAGTSYLIGIGGDTSGVYLPFYDGPDGIRGDFTLRTVFTPETHDTFATRRLLSGARVETTSSNLASITAGADPAVDEFDPRAPLWWSWTAPIDGLATFSTAGSEFDTTLAVFTGDPPTAESRIAANDDDSLGRKTSELSIPVQAGTAYHVLVDSADDTAGRVALAIWCAPTPSNDAFSARALVPDTTTVATGTNLGATAEPGEPDHAFMRASRSVWWTWTASQPGEYVVTTAGSDFDTVLGVYTGDSLATLQWVGGNDDAADLGLPSRVAFRATPGTSYHIAVDGYRVAAGAIELRVLRRFPRPIDIAMPYGPIQAGSPLTISAIVGTTDFHSYQWFHNGVPIPGATERVFNIPIAQRFHAGSYTVEVTSLLGPTMSGPVTVVVESPPPSHATVSNLSTRALCRGGDEILIPGFVISGTGTRRLLMRAVGPELVPFGVRDVLIDPAMILTRRDDDGFTEIARNEDWADQPAVDEIAVTSAAIHAFPLDQDGTSAAILMDLSAGVYTIHVASSGTGTGIALVEFYDVPADGPRADTAQITNLSNRGFAGTGDAVMIPGFVVEGDSPRTFLLRAVGPGLGSMGVTGVLADPQLRLFRHRDDTADLVLTNDSWGENGDTAEIIAAAASAGAFALVPGSEDAALVVALPSGVYTVHASGAEGTSGVVLVELYLLP